jgi:hypothetical protein
MDGKEEQIAEGPNPMDVLTDARAKQPREAISVCKEGERPTDRRKAELWLGVAPKILQSDKKWLRDQHHERAFSAGRWTIRRNRRRREGLAMQDKAHAENRQAFLEGPQTSATDQLHAEYRRRLGYSARCR